MGKNSMQKATGLTKEDRENLAISGKRKSLNTVSYPKPEVTRTSLFRGVRKKRLTPDIPLEFQNMILDALSASPRMKIVQHPQ